MRAVWKFPLDFMGPTGYVNPHVTLEMPAGAQVVALQTQRDTPCLWVLVDPHAERERRTFVVVGSGHEIPDEAGEHVGTWQALNTFVWHLFEVKP